MHHLQQSSPKRTNRILAFLICSVLFLGAFAQEKSADVMPQNFALPADSTLYFPVPQLPTFWHTPWLHEGFNAALSLSATVGLGGHHPKGVGFGKSISLAYAAPLGKRFSYTLGMNTDFFNWGGLRYREASIAGALNYQCNDIVSLTLEGYKEIVHPNLYPFLRDRMHPDKYLGGAINFQFNRNVFMQISVGTGEYSAR